MVIYEDTRNQVGKHKTKNQWFHDNGIQVYRTKLPVGDYALSTDLRVCIDTKKNLQELCSNVCQQHKRFVSELMQAEALGIHLIVLCEHGSQITCLEDVKEWVNPRLKTSPKALTGEKLYKILHTIMMRYDCQFLFCTKADAGKRIIELLNNRGGKIDNIGISKEFSECEAFK